MTLSKAFTFATLALVTSTGAFAQSLEATPYHYGMALDIAQVIAVEAPATTQGHTATATMTYRDSSGQVRTLSYSQPNTTLANQN